MVAALLALALAAPPDDRLTTLSAMREELGRSMERLRLDGYEAPYFLAYQVAGTKEGRWRSIRVEVRNPNLRVRARRGYLY